MTKKDTASLTPVFTLYCRNDRSNCAGRANAVLIDKLRNIFVTNAHVVYGCHKPADTKYTIYMPHAPEGSKAVHQKKWVNWKTDTAWLHIPDQDLTGYTVPALNTSPAEEQSTIQIISSDHDDNPNKAVYNGRILASASQFGVSGSCLQDVYDAKSRFFVSKRDKYLLYDQYILSIIEGKSRLSNGTSGAAALNKAGEIIGILSGSQADGTFSIVIPAKELAFRGP